jgi:hypothetical protein
MKTAEEIANQLSFRIVEHCETNLSRTNKENWVRDEIKAELEACAQQNTLNRGKVKEILKNYFMKALDIKHEAFWDHIAKAICSLAVPDAEERYEEAVKYLSKTRPDSGISIAEIYALKIAAGLITNKEE